MHETPMLPESAWWVAALHIPRLGPTRIERLVQHFGTMQAAWEAPATSLRSILPDDALKSFLEARQGLDVADLFSDATRDGAEVMCLADPEYPLLLQEIPSPPPVLFYRGRMLETDTAAVAIVGTRKMTRYGQQWAHEIAYDLAKAGVTIVSGLALGVDGVAHRAALEAGGRTIAVLGSGIDVIYPGSHRDLASRIAEQGAVLTEYLPGTAPDRYNFPARNRIISGLSRGVVVIEAPEKSGALITVDFAAEQGRDAFAVPGPIGAANSAGCLRILREGATLVRGAEDILEDLRLTRLAPTEDSLPGDLSAEERRLLSLLTNEPQHIDDIASRLGKSVNDVSSELMMLELQGTVQSATGGYYSRR